MRRLRPVRVRRMRVGRGSAVLPGLRALDCGQRHPLFQLLGEEGPKDLVLGLREAVLLSVLYCRGVEREDRRLHLSVVLGDHSSEDGGSSGIVLYHAERIPKTASISFEDKQDGYAVISGKHIV